MDVYEINRKLRLRLRHWLSLFVCVSAQAMYGASAVSRHFGDAVLWELDPPAAGEVLIRAGEHIRGCCAEDIRGLTRLPSR